MGEKKDNVYGFIVFVIIISMVFLIIYYTIICSHNMSNTEHMIPIKPIKNASYSRTGCPYYMSKTLKKVLDDNKINSVKYNGNVHFVCGYDEIDSEINKIYPNHDQRIHIIHNADYISSKDYLWNRLVLSFGLNKAKTYMPNTYILSNIDDRDRLKREFNGIYIMKKNIQRQEGLKITDSLDEILSAPRSYVIAQELLQNPYTINVKKDGVFKGNRKTNMRFYILVVCKNNDMDVFVYNDGFMYYTNENWVKGSKEIGPNITTGYIDRWIYEQNPLTHTDFKNFLDDNNRILSNSEQNIKNQGLKLSNIVFSRIYSLLRDVLISSIGKACNGDKLRNNVTFQLFGADIALNDELWPQIMEINKGPDMGSKDERDGMIKNNCTRDMLRIIGVIDNDKNSNGFILLFSKEKDIIKDDTHYS